MIRYRLRIQQPERHLVNLRVDLPARPGPTEIHLPAWSPGSYLIRDYARHVGAMRARDGRGRALAVEKTGKSTWTVAAGSGRLRLDYTIYAFERSVRTSHVTSDHAFLHGPTLFVYREEDRMLPARLKLEIPKGWKAASALATRRGELVAENYDQLVDSPIECGHHRELEFKVASTPMRAVFCGQNGLDRKRLRRDFPRIAAAQHKLFGEFPFASYLAIVNFTVANRGGLEHQSSMAVEWPGYRFHGDEQYQDFLSLLSHELFHAWNVKASRPARLMPFDYGRECPTRLLWWYEGVTDYYADLMLRRAHLLTPAGYLKRLAEQWEKLLLTPGRLALSVADASFDAWIRHYRQDENSPNSSISYYLKGHLLGALLDLELRGHSAGRHSLDEVVRQVYREGQRGLPENGVESIVEQVLGESRAGWFLRYVHGTQELPLPQALATVGLRATPIAPKPSGGWLGAHLKASDGRVQVTSVLRDGPAERAGVSAGDLVVAADRYRVDLETLNQRLEDLKPGDRTTLSFFRHDVLREAVLTLGRVPPKIRFVRRAKTTATQRAAAESWLHCKFSEIPSEAK